MNVESNTAAGTSIAPVKPPRKLVKKLAKKTAAAKPAKAASKPAGDGSTLKTILGQLKLDGRPARRKLRAAGLAFHNKRERWVFTPAQAAKAREILKA